MALQQLLWERWCSEHKVLPVVENECKLRTSHHWAVRHWTAKQGCVQYSSRQYLCAWKSFPSVAFETVPVLVWLAMAVPDPSSFQGRSSGAYSFHASLIQAIDGAMSSALCPQVVSRAPQHFRSSKTHPLEMVALPASFRRFSSMCCWAILFVMNHTQAHTHTHVYSLNGCLLKISADCHLWIVWCCLWWIKYAHIHIRIFGMAAFLKSVLINTGGELSKVIICWVVNCPWISFVGLWIVQGYHLLGGELSMHIICWVV